MADPGNRIRSRVCSTGGEAFRDVCKCSCRLVITAVPDHNTDWCPSGVPTGVQPGDGAGGSETKLGDLKTDPNSSQMDALSKCYAWAKRMAAGKCKGFNGVTIGSSGASRGCWCEKGMTSVRKAGGYRTAYACNWG